ncbi:MAG TPA: hypothetical protein VMU50_07750 [Polyangia bacterium]|nr:hypothetical protein [Polyangia bacterium]
MGLGLIVAPTAGGQEREPQNAPPADRDRAASPGGDRDSPREPASLRETGRVGSTSVNTQGFPIDDGRVVTPDPAEMAVTPMPMGDDDADVGGGAAASTGHIAPAVLEPEIDARMTGALVCRLEIARRKRITTDQVRAETLELRWVILPSGRVGGQQVVATSPVDPDVMSCVKRRMASWTFTAPTGGAVSLSRNLSFK